MTQFVSFFMVIDSPCLFARCCPLSGAAAAAWLTSTKQSINLQHTHVLLSLIWQSAHNTGAQSFVASLLCFVFVCMLSWKKSQSRLSLIFGCEWIDIFFLFCKVSYHRGKTMETSWDDGALEGRWGSCWMQNEPLIVRHDAHIWICRLRAFFTICICQHSICMLVSESNAVVRNK